MKSLPQNTLTIFTIALLAAVPSFSIAQESQTTPESTQGTESTENTEGTETETKEEKKEEKREEQTSAAELTTLHNEIQDHKNKINELQEQEKSLENEKKIIENKILKAEKDLMLSEKQLAELDTAIGKTATKIKETKKEIKSQKKILADYLRLIQRYDNVTYLEILLSSNSLSSFINQIEYTQTLQEKTNEALNQYQNLNQTLENKKEKLETKQEEEIQVLTLLESQREDLEFLKIEKDLLIKETQNDEAKYQDLLSDKQTRFELLRVQIQTTAPSGSAAIPINDAYQYADYASQKTGVRAAVIMAVIEQETRFGSNVGTGTYKVDMNPSQQPFFEAVCAKLGLDPDATPVSKKPVSYKGWGGAMGPGQIMPRQWTKIENEVAQFNNKTVANPWDNQDAFMGTAIMLRNLGAGNPSQEFEAVGRYFAGGYWKKYSWYAENVLEKAKKY